MANEVIYHVTFTMYVMLRSNLVTSDEVVVHLVYAVLWPVWNGISTLRSFSKDSILSTTFCVDHTVDTTILFHGPL